MKTYYKRKPSAFAEEYYLHINDDGIDWTIPVWPGNRHYNQAVREVMDGEAEIIDDF